MKETVLLTGYTDFISDAFLAATFKNNRIVITGNTEMKTSFKNRITVYRGELTDRLARKIFKTYDVDKIVYFSGSTAPFSDISGSELQSLSVLFSYCTQDMRTIYVTGPQHPDVDSISVMEKSALDICSRASWQTGGINVVVSPWIYDMDATQPSLMQYFERGVHEMDYNEEQNLSFLASEDLSLLLLRMFDDWEQAVEPYYIPNVFVNTAKVFASMVIAESDNEDIEFEFSPRRPFELSEARSNKLRSRFIWFPIYSMYEDLPEIIRRYRARERERVSPLEKFFSKNSILLRILELLFGFVVMELVLRLSGIVSQFRMIDFRLLYVVIYGTIYNMPMGLGAAALASFSLVWAYSREGINWITLFYEPTNWLPFIAFFCVGAICGYIRERDRERLESQKNETDSLSERYDYLASINEDILQEKREYKSQIIGSRDSFGKIFDITRQLDSDHPKYLLANAVGIIERVMRNATIGIYDCSGGSAYGRLSVSSRDVNYPGSVKMQDYYDRVTAINQGEVWVNRDLEEGLPFYMYAVWNKDKIESVILLKEADFSQMTLYYENLFKVLCGLISASLLRANAYQRAIHATRCVDGTANVLKESCFIEDLKYAIGTGEKSLATYLLLRVSVEAADLAEAEAKIATCIRKTDIIGFCNNEIFVLLQQASEKELPIIGRRFENAGIGYKAVSKQEQRDMLEGGAG